MSANQRASFNRHRLSIKDKSQNKPIFSEEDYRLNSSVFNQPEHLRSVIDFNETKLANKVSVFCNRESLLVHFEHKFENVFKRVATENNVRQRSKDIYKSLNAINQEIQARGHHNEHLLFSLFTGPPSVTR